MAVGPESPETNRVTLMGIHPRNGNDAVNGFREASKLGSEALKEFVAEHYKGAGWKRDEIIRGMLEADDFYGNEMVQLKLPILHNGRFVLVGDASYATGPTGTGTSLAIAGAYILAGEVGKCQGDLAAGLEGYEERMRPLINEMQQIPPLVPMVLAPQTALGIWLRNTIFAFICWSKIQTVFQRFFGGSAAHSDESKVPEYEWRI